MAPPVWDNLRVVDDRTRSVLLIALGVSLPPGVGIFLAGLRVLGSQDLWLVVGASVASTLVLFAGIVFLGLSGSADQEFRE